MAECGLTAPRSKLLNRKEGTKDESTTEVRRYRWSRNVFSMQHPFALSSRAARLVCKPREYVGRRARVPPDTLAR